MESGPVLSVWIPCAKWEQRVVSLQAGGGYKGAQPPLGQGGFLAPIEGVAIYQRFLFFRYYKHWVIQIAYI